MGSAIVCVISSKNSQINWRFGSLALIFEATSYLSWLSCQLLDDSSLKIPIAPFTSVNFSACLASQLCFDLHRHIPTSSGDLCWQYCSARAPSDTPKDSQQRMIRAGIHYTLSSGHRDHDSQISGFHKASCRRLKN